MLTALVRYYLHSTESFGGAFLPFTRAFQVHLLWLRNVVRGCLFWVWKDFLDNWIRQEKRKEGKSVIKKTNVYKRKTARGRVNWVASLERKAKGAERGLYSIKETMENSTEWGLITVPSGQGSLKEEAAAAITQLCINTGLPSQWGSIAEKIAIKVTGDNTNNHIYTFHKNPSNKINVQSSFMHPIIQ